jgi:hypothetical protein
MLTFEVLQVLIFLLPGLLSETVLNVLCIRQDRGDIQKVFEALMFALPVYALYSIFKTASPLVFQDGTLKYDWPGMLLLVGLALLLPAALSLLHNKGWLMCVLTRWGITRRTGRTSIWEDVLCEKAAYIVLHFRDGSLLYGWPEFYSDDPDKRALFVSQAEWLTEGEEPVPVEGRGILVWLDPDVAFTEVHRGPCPKEGPMAREDAHTTAVREGDVKKAGRNPPPPRERKPPPPAQTKKKSS